MNLLYRLGRSLANRGVLSTAKLSLGAVGHWVGSRVGRGHPAEPLPAPLDFDRVLGVDTDAGYTPGKRDVRGTNWRHGGRYQGVDPLLFTKVFDELKISFAEFTFVDLGSGKGRALLLAARYPFARIIGVEYSQSLHRIAERNLARCPAEKKVCQDIHAVCLDAAEFAIPPGPLVIFMYNPFWPPVMEKVIANLQASLRAQPRRIIVTYFNPQHAELWERTGFVAPILHSDAVAVYDTDRARTLA